MNVLKYFKKCTIQKVSKCTITALAFSGVMNYSSLNAKTQDPYQALEQKYKEKVLEKLNDNILTLDEVFELQSFLSKNEILLNNKNSTKINEEKKEDLEKITNNYPGLIDEKARFTYNPEQVLNTEEQEMLRSVLEKSGNEELKKMLNETLTLRSLTIAYYDKEPTGESNTLTFEEKKNQELIKKKLKKHSSTYEKYIAYAIEFETSIFNNKKERFNKSFSPGLFIWLATVPNNFEAAQKDILHELKEYTGVKEIKAQSIEEQFPNYPFPKGRSLALSLVSLFFPLIVRACIKKYRNDERWTDEDKWYHGLDCAASAFGIDLLAPWVFYVRLAGPVIHETLKGLVK
ncbi:hypothetical protein HY837_01635 [archaeon]|nr:hypothetical protein [archaeon]